MERTSMNLELQPYLGSWDIGGGLVVEKKKNGFFLQPAIRVRIDLVFLYMLILVAVPGVGAFVSPGLYAAYDVVRDSGNVGRVIIEHPRFLAACIGYGLFALSYPIWAIFFRAKRMVLFSISDHTVVIGRFWQHKARFTKRRIPIENIREIEILHTFQHYRGGTTAMKEKYFLSVVADDEEPFYIIRLPDEAPMIATMKVVANEFSIPLVRETFPAHHGTKAV